MVHGIEQPSVFKGIRNYAGISTSGLTSAALKCNLCLVLCKGGPENGTARKAARTHALDPLDGRAEILWHLALTSFGI